MTRASHRHSCVHAPPRRWRRACNATRLLAPLLPGCGARFVHAGAAALLASALVFRCRDERLILALVASRLLFVPAFHLAAVLGGGPPAMGLLTLALGASNGHLTTVSMMEGAAAAPPGAAELAGNLLVLSLILGLCVGAAAGFLWLLV